MLEIARDNALARFVAGGRSSSEISAIADTGKQEDTEENRIRGKIELHADLDCYLYTLLYMSVLLY